MTNEEVIDNICCALGNGCQQVCNSKIRGECTDSEIIEAMEIAVKALEKQIPKKMLLVGDDRKKIVRCPKCNINNAVAYYTDGEITGTTCFGDIPPIAKYCKFCGQALMEV